MQESQSSPTNALSRLGARLGASGGTLATVAFFLAWLTFTPTSCSGRSQPVTQSGWELLLKSTSPFIAGPFFLPILLGAVLCTFLHLYLLRILRIPSAADDVPRVASGTFILAVLAWAYFALFLLQVVGNRNVQRLQPGLYLEISGLALLLVGTIFQVVGTMPARTEQRKNRILGFVSVALACYPILLIVALFTNRWLSSLWSHYWWVFVISLLLALGAGVFTGRRALHKAGDGVARWGLLLSLSEFAIIAALAVLLAILVAPNYLRMR